MNLKYTGFNWCTKKLIKEYNAKPFLVHSPSLYMLSLSLSTPSSLCYVF